MLLCYLRRSIFTMSVGCIFPVYPLYDVIKGKKNKFVDNKAQFEYTRPCKLNALVDDRTLYSYMALVSLYTFATVSYQKKWFYRRIDDFFFDDMEGIMYSISDKVIEAFGVTIHLYIVRYFA